MTGTDPRLLRYYNRELQHVREMGAEFARAYPKIAGRLGMEGFECADPYVERLLEGFAFLAARVQLKLDAQYPVFTQHMLEMLYPHYLAPVPSMAVVQLQADTSESKLAAGYQVARDTALLSLISGDDRTACEYRTAHEVFLWPLELSEAKYFESPSALSAAGIVIPPGQAARAGLRLRFTVTGGIQTHMLKLDRLPIFITGVDEVSRHLYEQLMGNALGYTLTVGETGAGNSQWLDAKAIQSRGFDDQDALLPYTERSFSGYRLLQEYFACPERFLFAEFTGLQGPLSRSKSNTLKLQCCSTGVFRVYRMPWIPAISVFSVRRRSICSPVAPTVSICSRVKPNTTYWRIVPARWTLKCTVSVPLRVLVTDRNRSNAFSLFMVEMNGSGIVVSSPTTRQPANPAFSQPVRSSAVPVQAI